MDDAVLGLVFLANAVLDVLLASFVWSRRRGGAGRALTAVLVATGLWSATYGAELLTAGTASVRWGDAKYLGIALLSPAWLAFVLCWTGRSSRVTPRLLGALAVEPVLVLVLLAVPATHDLVRYVDPSSPPGEHPTMLSGPLFWPHLAYTNIVLVGWVAVFVVSVLRRSRHYVGDAAVLVAAALLPFVANLGFNLTIGGLARVDLTPLAFTVTTAVLVRALLERRMLRLAPIAHRRVVDGMDDGVLVVDGEHRVVEANPAALRVVGWAGGGWRGRDLPAELRDAAASTGRHDVVLHGDQRLDLDVQVSDLPDARGHAGGRLLVLRDATARRRTERRRAAALSEQARVATTLSRSLRPNALPEVPGARLAAVYRPSGRGHEIGGDFYDVYPLGEAWAFAIGDVSGKGASSAAITAMARYTLRALSRPGRSPSQALAALNGHMLDDSEDETYLTIAHGVLEPRDDGTATVRIALGGHLRPFLLPADGTAVRPVGEPGGAIGLLPELGAVDVDLELAPGDTLVLFTDGVTEARRGRELFGEERLVATLQQERAAVVEALAERVVSEVLSFQSGVAADDIAVLVIRAGSGESGGQRGPRELERQVVAS